MTRARILWLRAALAVLCLLPFANLVLEYLRDDLTANPIERITLQTGWWGLTILLTTLAITPLRRLTGWNQLVRFRRMLGLFAFFYICLHFLTYLVLDHFFYWPTIVEDVFERPFITVGFTAFLLMIPLAITSTKGWIRRLGRGWQRLHRLVYLSAGLGVLHYYWKVKADTRLPLLFACVLAVLLLARAGPALRRRAARRASRASASPPLPAER